MCDIRLTSMKIEFTPVLIMFPNRSVTANVYKIGIHQLYLTARYLKFNSKNKINKFYSIKFYYKIIKYKNQIRKRNKTMKANKII